MSEIVKSMVSSAILIYLAIYLLSLIAAHCGIASEFDQRGHLRTVICIKQCDESVASPLIISISPSLIRRPSPGSRREWVCERGGALKQPGLAACDEAHT